MTMRFRLLAGCHNQGEMNADGTHKIYNPGQVVKSNSNLAEMFPEKFRRLHDDEPDTDESVATAVAEGEDAESLNAMTVNDLRQYAEDEEIDLGNATKKPDIIAAILKATR